MDFYDVPRLMRLVDDGVDDSSTRKRPGVAIQTSEIFLACFSCFLLRDPERILRLGGGSLVLLCGENFSRQTFVWRSPASSRPAVLNFFETAVCASRSPEKKPLTHSGTAKPSTAICTVARSLHYSTACKCDWQYAATFLRTEQLRRIPFQLYSITFNSTKFKNILSSTVSRYTLNFV